MIIIGDYRIRKADALNWNIEELRIPQEGKDAGKEIWKAIGFYTDLAKVCTKLMEILTKEGYEDTEDLQDVLDLITEAKEAVVEAIKEMK